MQLDLVLTVTFYRSQITTWNMLAIGISHINFLQEEYYMIILKKTANLLVFLIQISKHENVRNNFLGKKNHL